MLSDGLSPAAIPAAGYVPQTGLILMRVYDFKCDACGNAFEAFLRTADEPHECPQCGSPKATMQPTLQISINTSGTRRGRVIDMSSNSCPCGGRKHAHH